MESVDLIMEPTAGKKQVRWGTVSVLEFRVGYNASAVPESGGPPVGLVGRPTRHSYALLPNEDVESDSDSECESEDSDVDEDMAVTSGCRRRSGSDLWLDPMERARLLLEDCAFVMEDVALICADVRATLDSRAFSRFDPKTEKTVDVQQQMPQRRCGDVCSAPREKVLLY
ncbi:hypothetical protein PHMEG_00026719 [Phytophthora megakarya]|uniref:Uncharacterized protein n=1 Tax=Phytophthora megakarya TaxID=4795 RepID=A0A225V7S1_9STRA|nr:hypothetical protein PHMEG_00026719 [Phytophthora megakarya]